MKPQCVTIAHKRRPVSVTLVWGDTPGPGSIRESAMFYAKRPSCEHGWGVVRNWLQDNALLFEAALSDDEIPDGVLLVWPCLFDEAITIPIPIRLRDDVTIHPYSANSYVQLPYVDMTSKTHHGFNSQSYTRIMCTKVVVYSPEDPPSPAAPPVEQCGGSNSVSVSDSGSNDDSTLADAQKGLRLARHLKTWLTQAYFDCAFITGFASTSTSSHKKECARIVDENSQMTTQSSTQNQNGLDEYFRSVAKFKLEAAVVKNENEKKQHEKHKKHKNKTNHTDNFGKNALSSALLVVNVRDVWNCMLRFQSSLHLDDTLEPPPTTTPEDVNLNLLYEWIARFADTNAEAIGPFFSKVIKMKNKLDGCKLDDGYQTPWPEMVNLWVRYGRDTHYCVSEDKEILSNVVPRGKWHLIPPHARIDRLRCIDVAHVSEFSISNSNSNPNHPNQIKSKIKKGDTIVYQNVQAELVPKQLDVRAQTHRGTLPSSLVHTTYSKVPVANRATNSLAPDLRNGHCKITMGTPESIFDEHGGGGEDEDTLDTLDELNPRGRCASKWSRGMPGMWESLISIMDPSQIIASRFWSPMFVRTQTEFSPPKKRGKAKAQAHSPGGAIMDVGQIDQERIFGLMDCAMLPDKFNKFESESESESGFDDNDDGGFTPRSESEEVAWCTARQLRFVMLLMGVIIDVKNKYSKRGLKSNTAKAPAPPPCGQVSNIKKRRRDSCTIQDDDKEAHFNKKLITLMHERVQKSQRLD